MGTVTSSYQKGKGGIPPHFNMFKEEYNHDNAGMSGVQDPLAPFTPLSPFSRPPPLQYHAVLWTPTLSKICKILAHTRDIKYDLLSCLVIT